MVQTKKHGPYIDIDNYRVHGKNQPHPLAVMFFFIYVMIDDNCMMIM